MVQTNEIASSGKTMKNPALRETEQTSRHNVNR
jgi:hypothetical protein